MATYGLTYLQIVNRVLERLRETSVASVTSTTLSTLVGHMVNQVASEIQEAWMWHAMRDTYTITTTPGVTTYALTDSGAEAIVIDGWNTTTHQPLERKTVTQFDAHFFGSAAIPASNPSEWVIAGRDTNNDIVVDTYPDSAAANTLKFSVYVPQDDLSAGGDVPLVPQNVLIEETIARMRAERGEEGAPQPMPGSTFILNDLLSSAIARDGGRTDPTEMDWEVE